MGWRGCGLLWGSILHFLDIGCRRREEVILTLQGICIWHPAKKRHDCSGGYFWYAVKRTDTGTLVRNSNVVVCTCNLVLLACVIFIKKLCTQNIIRYKALIHIIQKDVTSVHSMFYDAYSCFPQQATGSHSPSVPLVHSNTDQHITSQNILKFHFHITV